MAYTCDLLLRTLPAIDYENGLQIEERVPIVLPGDIPRPDRSGSPRLDFTDWPRPDRSQLGRHSSPTILVDIPRPVRDPEKTPS